jgi:hypothetical protein
MVKYVADLEGKDKHNVELQDEGEFNAEFSFLFNNQPDALIIQIYSVIKLYMFRASSLLIIRSFLLYFRHW